MKDKEKILTVISALFIGLFLGFCFSPIKKGIHIEIKNNGNQLPNQK